LAFNQTFEGQWASSSKLNKFEESNGDLRFSLKLIFPNSEYETMLIPSFIIYDGKYIENLYILKLQNHIFRNSSSTYFNIDKEEKKLNGSFNSFVVYRSLFDRTENYSKFLCPIF